MNREFCDVNYETAMQSVVLPLHKPEVSVLAESDTGSRIGSFMLRKTAHGNTTAGKRCPVRGKLYKRIDFRGTLVQARAWLEQKPGKLL